jgi:hypothetical protein
MPAPPAIEDDGVPWEGEGAPGEGESPAEDEGLDYEDGD